MRKTVNITATSYNPTAAVLADHFFQDGQRAGDITVSFRVDDNPFDPRIGTSLSFFILTMKRLGGTMFKLCGAIVEPAGTKVTSRGWPIGFHKATVEYDVATRSGLIRIRG